MSRKSASGGSPPSPHSGPRAGSDDDDDADEGDDLILFLRPGGLPVPAPGGAGRLSPPWYDGGVPGAMPDDAAFPGGVPWSELDIVDSPPGVLGCQCGVTGARMPYPGAGPRCPPLCGDGGDVDDAVLGLGPTPSRPGRRSVKLFIADRAGASRPGSWETNALTAG